MLAFTFATAANAGTKVRVVGTCRIEVRAELTPNEVNIVGTLNADDGEPVSHSSVRLALSGSDDRAPAILNVVTGGDGSFHATMSPIGEGPYSLTATTSATEWVLPAVRTIKVARGKEHPHIWFVGPRPLEINLDQPKVPIDVQVESSMPIELWLEDSRTHTKIAQTVSATGMAHYVVDSKLLGPPGKGDLSIASVANATSDEAGDSIDTVRGARAIIDAHVTLPGLLSGQTVMVSGSIRDQLGDPMPGAIELFRGKTRLGVATLRAGGRFELRVSGIGDSEPTSVRLHPVASSDGWQVRDDSIEIDARAGVLRHALVLVSLAALVAAFAIAARRSPTNAGEREETTAFVPVQVLTKKYHGGPIQLRVLDATRGHALSATHVVVTRAGNPCTRVEQAESDLQGRVVLRAARPGDGLLVTNLSHQPRAITLPRSDSIELRLMHRKDVVVQDLLTWAIQRFGRPVGAQLTPLEIARFAPNQAKWANAVNEGVFGREQISEMEQKTIKSLATAPLSVDPMGDQIAPSTPHDANNL